MGEGVATTKQIAKITPILQELFIQHIELVLAHLDARNYYQAWICLRDFVIFCPPTVKKPLAEDVEAIQGAINVIAEDKQCGLYAQKVTQMTRINSVVASRIFGLCEKLMAELYRQGYLEKHREWTESTME